MRLQKNYKHRLSTNLGEIRLRNCLLKQPSINLCSRSRARALFPSRREKLRTHITYEYHVAVQQMTSCIRTPEDIRRYLKYNTLHVMASRLGEVV